MFGVSRLHHLQELNLSDNGILTIEGLKDLVHLKHLNLKGNCIKTIEHLNTNAKLEYLNLSENNIAAISDISFLKNLKVFDWYTEIEIFSLFLIRLHFLFSYSHLSGIISAWQPDNAFETM